MRNPETWSNSKLRLRGVCGWAFKREILDGIEREPNPALEGGSNAHGGIEFFVRSVLDDEPFIDITAMARAATHGTPEEMADLLPILGIMQESMLEEPPPIRARHVIAVEKRLAMPIDLPGGGSAVFDGKADLISADGKRCTIDDWKTHWRPLTQEVFEADPQLKRYALLVDHHHPGFEEFTIRMRFVRYAGAVREMTLTRADLEMVRWDLAAEIEEREAMDTFDATPGDWCNLCGHTANCPRVRAFLEDGVQLTVSNDAEATAAAEVVRAIDAHSASLKRKLKGYLGAEHPTGRVPLSGGTYGYGPQRKKRAETDDVFDVWEAFGRPMNTHAFRVDVDALSRTLDREPGAVRAAMAAVVEEYEIPHCRYRRGDASTTEDEADDE